MNISSQKCCKCKQEKPVEQFVKNWRSSTGYNWTCKACVKEYQLSIKDKLKAYQHEYQKQYRVEHKEELYKRVQQWQKDNPEKHRAHLKKSNLKRQDKRKTYMKEYRLRKKLEKKLNDQQQISGTHL